MLAFDPGAEYCDFLGNGHIVEAVAERLMNGRLCITLITDDDIIGQVVLRADFLDALITARSGEAAA
jgi:hypothetical protein